MDHGAILGGMGVVGELGEEFEPPRRRDAKKAKKDF
jgi:hypothetical protein